METPFVIPDNPADQAQEESWEEVEEEGKMDHGTGAQPPEDTEAEARERTELMETSAKVTSDPLDLLEDHRHILISKWLVLMNLPAKITEEGLKEILMLLNRSLNLSTKLTSHRSLARRKKCAGPSC